MSTTTTRVALIVASLAATFALPAVAFAFQPPADAAAAAATTEGAATRTAEAGDPVRGKRVFQGTGKCTYCHGWAGDGRHGKHPRSPGIAANLRESQLDTESMMQIVRCGIPGTEMPYHVTAAYKDAEICGMTMEDFAEGDLKPVRGNTFRDKDVANVVAYIQTVMQGQGEVTLEDCEEALKPGDKACDEFR